MPPPAALGWPMTASSPRGPVQLACPPQLQRRLPGGSIAAVSATVAGFAPPPGFGAAIRSSSATFAPTSVQVHGYPASVRSSSLAGGVASFPAVYTGVAGVRSPSSSSNTAHVAGFSNTGTVRNASGTCNAALQSVPNQVHASNPAASVAVAPSSNAVAQQCMTCVSSGVDTAASVVDPSVHITESGASTEAVSSSDVEIVQQTIDPIVVGFGRSVESDCAPAGQATIYAKVASEESDEDMIAPSRLFSASKRMLLISTINFIFKHISRDHSELEAMPNSDTFKAFQERQYHQNKVPNPYLDPFTKTLQDSSAGHVTEFILMMLHRGYFDVSEFIVSVVYLVRFKEKTGIPLHVSAWRPLFITSLLLADKMWEDKSVKNSSLTMLFPVLSNAELFDLEVRFLEWLGFSAWVAKKDFQQFCETLLLVDGSAPEISAQVVGSEYGAALQDGTTEALPPAKPASMRHGGCTRLEQPWNARKTLHGYSPSKRHPAGQSAPAVGKTSLALQTNGAACDNDILFSNVSPRRKPVSQSQALGPSNCKGHAALHQGSLSAAPRNCSSECDAVCTSAEIGSGPLGIAQSPRRPALARMGEQHAPLQVQERRPTSEPRVVPQAAAVGIRVAKGRPSPSIVACPHGHQPRASLQGVQAVSAASPRAEVGNLRMEQKLEGGGTMQNDRCSSEPATLGRGSQPASGSMPTGSTKVSKLPPDAQQRVGFPFGPTARSTVPMPGLARTSRAGQPMVMPVPDMRRNAVHSGGVGGAQIATVVHSAGLLGRGRSSSPAGIADGGYVPPPSARRNVAAPPPTMRPAGLRLG